MDRRTLLKSGLALPLAASMPFSGAVLAPAGAVPRITRVLAKRIQVPWGIAFLPSGDALVSERNTGRIYRVGSNGGKVAIGSVPGTHSETEGGLLGLALHPAFIRTRLVYAYLTTVSDNRVVRMKYVGGRLGAPRPVLTGIPSRPYHNGGGLAFGPGGYLFVSTGDAGNADSAQDKGSLAGKILRLTPRGGTPTTNPFGNKTWSYGHRNPEQIAFKPNGTLWASEFGENDKDELNKIVKGHNYGWPFVEGKDGPGRYHDPLVQWNTDDCSPSGIAILAGRAWLGALQGECIYSVRLAGPNRGRVQRYFTGQFGRIRSVAAAPDGTLWMTTSNRDGRGVPGARDDRIFKVSLS